ncbi:MAG TPA: alkaline phosphatase PhoX [Acidimicrobiales bacterium]|nr:alkaline phosphatase PhoX [Acidimicrobiales bacterium]
MDRRRFLLLSLAASGSLTLGRGVLAPVFAAPAQPADSPYGPLGAADANGLRLPDGFSSRIVRQWNQPIEGTTQLPMPFPDGAATFPTGDGGWILVSNSENPPPVDQLAPLALPGLGGVQGIRFAADGSITDAYPILTGSRSNCAGGVTPWGTWLSCEEVDDPTDPTRSGRVYECDPTGATPARELPALGYFKHENATVDPEREQVYLSEDLGDGLFYRFTPTAYPDLSAGLLEAAAVADDGSVTWLPIPDPTCTQGTPCRQQAPGATAFASGEGCAYDAGLVFLTTKGDDRVWVYDVGAGRMEVLYDAADFDDPVLTGVDHLIVQPGTGNLLVAEDGGDMQVVMIRRDDFAVFPVLQMTGPQHGQQLPGALGQIPIYSEVSGLAFSPDGTRLYCNSQRGLVGGITYEVQGPWQQATSGRGGRPDGRPPQSPPGRARRP